MKFKVISIILLIVSIIMTPFVLIIWTDASTDSHKYEFVRAKVISSTSEHRSDDDTRYYANIVYTYDGEEYESVIRTSSYYLKGTHMNVYCKKSNPDYAVSFGHIWSKAIVMTFLFVSTIGGFVFLKISEKKNDVKNNNNDGGIERFEYLE